MSKTIDEKIVEMKFNNKDFETNVKSSLSTLDKLKEKLNLTGASKGLENIEKAANKINFNNMNSALESVSVKFSALDIIAATALQNITNTAVNAGKNLLKSLSIDQVASGWSKYGQKTGSVQTIMNATGKSIDEVNQYLDKLMWFSDETSYGLTDMTAALGQLTASGGDINKLVPMIMGVANATAYAGKGAAEFSRVMYNLNQSYSAGSLQYMDWKSLELAGVASKELKQTIIDTGVELGKINKGQVTIANFSQTLKDKWADTSVMEKSFGKFYTMTEEAYKMIQSGQVETASEAYEILSEKYDGLAITAAKAAQEAKTFGEAIDATKDAVSSQWTKIFEAIFGNYVQAKRLWTDLANTLYDVFAQPLSNAADRIKAAFSKSFDPIKNTLKAIASPAKKAAEAVKTVTDSMQNMDEIVQRVIRGDFKNAPERFELLAQAGYNAYAVQNKVNEALGCSFRYSEELADRQVEVTTTTEEVTEANNELLETLIKKSEEELKSLGYSEEQINALKELKKYTDKTGLSVKEFMDNIDDMDGRWFFIESFKNVGRSLIKILESIKEAWDDVFNPGKGEEGYEDEKANKLFDLVAALHKFSLKLKMSDETAEKLRNTFKGLFAILDIGLKIVSGPFKIGLKLLNVILGALGYTLLDVTSFLGNFIYNIDKWLTSSDTIVAKTKVVVEWIGKMAREFRDFIKTNETVHTILNAVGASFVFIFTKIKDGLITFKEFVTTNERILEVLQRMREGFSNAGKGISEWAKGLKEADNIPKYIFEGLIKGIANGAKGVFSAMAGMAMGLVEVIKKTLQIHSPSKVMFAIGGFIVAGLIAGMRDQSINLFDLLKGFGNKMIEFFKDLKLGDVVSIGVSAGILVLIKKLLDLLKFLAKPMDGLNNMLNSLSGMFSSFGDTADAFTKRIKYDAITSIIKSMGNFILKLALAIVVLGKLPVDQLKQGSIVLGALIGILVGLIGIVALLSKRLAKVKAPDMGKTFVVIASISVGMLIMSKALKNVSKIDPTNMFSSILGLAACAGGMLLLILAFNKLAGAIKGTKTDNIKQMAKIFTNISASMLIMSVALRLMSGVKEAAIYKTIGIFGGFIALLTAIGLINKYTKNSLIKAGESIKAVGISLLLLVVVMKLSGSLKKEHFLNGLKVIGVFLTFLVALMGISKIFKGTEMIKVSGSLLLIIGAIGLLTVSMKLLSRLDKTEILKGLICISLFGVFIGVLIGVSKQSASLHGSTLIGMSVAILALSVATTLLGLMDPDKVWNGIKAVAALSVFVALLTKVANGFNASADGMKILITLTVMITLLAVAIIGLSFIDSKRLLSAAGSLGIVMTSLATLVAATSKLKVDGKAIKTLVTLSLLMAALIGVVVGLSKVENIDRAVSGAIGISILVGSLVLVASALNKFDQRKKINWKGIGQLALLIPVLGLLAVVLNSMGNVQNAVQNALGLTILLGAMTGVTALLGVIGKFLGGQALLGIVGMGLLCAELLIVVQVLKQMDGLQNASANCTALSILVGALTIALLGISAVGAIYMATAGIAATGLIGMLALIGELFLVVELLRQMSDISNVMPNVIALTILLDAITTALVRVSLVGPLALIADVALLGLIGVLTTFGVLATAVGALMTKFPQLKSFLEEGLPVLEMISLSIGKVLGNLVGGFLSGATDGLPEVGTKLSEFMTNALPFITIAQTITNKLGEGVKALSGALFSLIGANMLESLDRFISKGESFSRLGTELSKFAVNAMPFISLMSTVKPESMGGAKSLADAILSLTASNMLQQLTSWFGGEIDISGFGSQLGSLGEGLNTFVSKLNGFGDDKIPIVDAACTALKSLADTAKEIPATGGLWQWLAGENDIGSFSEQLPLVATGVVGFVNTLTSNGFTEDKIKIVEAGCKALQALADVAKAIPAQDGFWQWLSGKQDLEDFASKFPKVAEGIMGFVNGLKEFSDNAVNKVNAACNIMWAIKDLSGIDLNGLSSNVETLGSRLVSFANKITEFSKSMNTVSVDDLTSSKEKLNEIMNIANTLVTVNSEPLEKFNNSLSTFATDSLKKFIDALNDAKPKADAENAIKNIIDVIIKVIGDKTPEVNTKCQDLVKSACDALLNSDITKAKNAGENFVQGFANGIKNKQYLAIDASSNLGKEALKAAKKSLDEHSPSKETFQIGTFFVQGLVNGIRKLTYSAYDSSYYLGEQMKQGLTNAMVRVSDLISSDMDTQPTIRPVLDLSDVENGVGSIGSMFNNPNLALASNLGAISVGMSRNRQNGDSEVVSAINKLSKSLSGAKGNTYNVNGITYDDGSEISNAVSELVRAARIERRV